MSFIFQALYYSFQVTSTSENVSPKQQLTTNQPEKTILVSTTTTTTPRTSMSTSQLPNPTSPPIPPSNYNKINGGDKKNVWFGSILKALSNYPTKKIAKKEVSVIDPEGPMPITSIPSTQQGEKNFGRKGEDSSVSPPTPTKMATAKLEEMKPFKDERLHQGKEDGDMNSPVNFANLENDGKNRGEKRTWNIGGRSELEEEKRVGLSGGNFGSRGWPVKGPDKLDQSDENNSSKENGKKASISFTSKISASSELPVRDAHSPHITSDFTTERAAAERSVLTFETTHMSSDMLRHKDRPMLVAKLTSDNRLAGRGNRKQLRKEKFKVEIIQSYLK